jgi:hypothetical protein
VTPLPPSVSEYLTSLRLMLEEADESSDPRVKLVALGVLERQAGAIRERWAESLVTL